LRQLIPWQPIIDGLVPFYNLKSGRTGCALRTLVAVSILARLRRKRSGSQNVALAILPGDIVPCRYGYAPLFAPGTLGTHPT
jgi:hypothetical protein